MIVYAAIDLRRGQAVQLVGGRPESQKVALPDPVAVAQRWIDAGIPGLHVVDLDAALGDGDNREIVDGILAVSTVPVQVGGGVRDADAIASLIDAGAARVIIGTRAVEDAEWRRTMAARFDKRLILAADVRGKRVMTRGWTNETSIEIEPLLRTVGQESLAGILITDVGREGQMVGIDVALFESISRSSVHPVIAAGGIRDLADLRILGNAGISGAVLGMSLYTGAIDPGVAATEFS